MPPSVEPRFDQAVYRDTRGERVSQREMDRTLRGRIRLPRDRPVRYATNPNLRGAWPEHNADRLGFVIFGLTLLQRSFMV